MPIYEFSCTDCGARTEVRASFAEHDAGLAPTCPECGGAALRKLLGRVAVHTARVPAIQGGGCCAGGACACSHA